MIKMSVRRMALSVSVLSTALLMAGHASAQNRQFSFAYDQPTTTAYGVAANIFDARSEEHTSELQSPYVISYAVFCLKTTNSTGGFAITFIPLLTTRLSTSGGDT